MKYRGNVIKMFLLLFPVIFGVSLLTFDISNSVANTDMISIINKLEVNSWQIKII